MDFDLSDEQRLLQGTVAKLVSDDAGRSQRRADPAPGDFRRALWHRFAEAGLLGLPFCELNGGFSGSPRDVMVVMEELGRALTPEPYVEAIVLSGGLLDFAGNIAQRQMFLPKVAAGDLLLAFAHNELGSRSKVAHVASRARRDGSSFVLDGCKEAIAYGQDAEMLIVSARTAGGETDAGGITLFLVDRNKRGVSLRGYPTIDGRRAAEIELVNVRVDVDTVLGTVDEALPLIQNAIDHAIAALCAEAIGIMECLNRVTLEYLKTRRQFGAPIGSFQVLQHRMVDMVIEHEQAKSLAILAALSFALPERASRRKAISAAKAGVGRAGRILGEQAIQLHGAIGMTDEYVAGRYFKRLLMIDRSFGDSDYHLSAFADEALPRS